MRKFRRRLCTSSVKIEIRHFHVVVVSVLDALNLLYGLDECVGRLQLRRGTQREYSTKPLKHSIVKCILVFKR